MMEKKDFKMKEKKHRIFHTISFIFTLILFLDSCNNNKIPSNAKVYTISMGLAYGFTIKDSGSGGLYLEGSPTIRDSTEFASLYKRVLDKKKINNKSFLLLDAYEESTVTESEIIRTKVTSISNSQSPYYPCKTALDNLLESFLNGSEEIEKLTKDDLLVFYYSGHGLSSSNEEKNGSLLLAPSKQGSKDVEYYSCKDLAEKLKLFPCQVIVIMDSCYSSSFLCNTEDGKALASSESFGANQKESLSFPSFSSVTNISGIFASRADEQSYIFSYPGKDFFAEENHSVFTGFMLKCLGWTHSQADVFETINTEEEISTNNFYNPLKSNIKVYGKLDSIPSLVSLENIYNQVNYFDLSLYSSSDVSQKTCLSISPISAFLIF